MSDERPRDVRRRLSYRLLERLVSKSYLAMAHLAARDLDMHELHHIVGAMEDGESVHCGADCRYRRWAKESRFAVHDQGGEHEAREARTDTTSEED